MTTNWQARVQGAVLYVDTIGFARLAKETLW